ncbi:MAG: peptidoglycan DD-metalloendopeptidase family protein, partial [bacterium]
RDITKTEGTLKTLKKDLKQVETQTRITEEKLTLSRQNLNSYKKEVTNELNVFYKEKLADNFWKILARNNTAGYFLREDKALKTLILGGYRSLVSTQEEIGNLETRRDSLTGRNKELASLSKAVSSNKYSYIKTKGKKSKILENTQSQELEAKTEIDKLKESARQLEAFITDLRLKLSEAEKRRLKSSGLVQRRGNLSWPVSGEVISLFGKYKRQDLDTYFFNNGIEIQGAKDSGVLAVEEGAVLFAGDFKGYGKTVIIEHSRDLCTVYSHLGIIKVRPGEYVKKKDVIGTLNGSSLYFEIRLDNKPEDPLLWLTSQEQEK